MIQVSEEDLRVGRGLDGHGGDDAIQTHSRQDGEDPPASFRRRFVYANAPRRPGITPRHLGRDAAFIEEDQLLGRDRPETGEEGFPPPEIPFRVSLGGVERLFFRRRPSSPTTRHI